MFHFGAYSVFSSVNVEICGGTVPLKSVWERSLHEKNLTRGSRDLSYNIRLQATIHAQISVLTALQFLYVLRNQFSMSVGFSNDYWSCAPLLQ